MKKLAIILTAGLLFGACSEDDSPNQTAPVAQNFDQLVVPSNFNWSNSQSSNIEVRFDKSQNSLIDLTGSELWVVNENMERVARELISGDKAQINITIPSMADGYQFYLKATGEYWPIQFEESVLLSLADPFDAELLGKLKINAKMGKTRAKANMSGANLFANPGFETDIPLANQGVGYFYPYSVGVNNTEWKSIDTDFTQPTQNGSKVIKAKNNEYTYFWQNHTVNPGDSIFLTGDNGGSFAYAYILFWQHQNSSSWSSYQRIDLTSNPDGLAMVVPSGQTIATGLFYIHDESWIDNAYFSNTPAVTDADGDGVADDQDDFPNDATRAYLSYYPNTGRQTIAFEDMWPVKGDYDFNDMIVNSKMTLTKNANDEWVSAEVEIALDAFGGGIENGLAIQLVDANKAALSNMNISVSGDATLDADVTNGIIVFSDPDAIRSDYYTNTENGKFATPDTARFTISFGANNGPSFIPDFYIFQTLNRSLEVHLPGFAGTAMADASLNNTGDDVNGTYLTSTGLPWGMELILPDGTNFEHPFEKTDMITAYPQFSTWASSGGSSNANWYQTPSIGNVIDLTN